MKGYTLKYSDEIVADFDRLSVFATEQHTPDFAKRYTAKLRKEIEDLSILAGIYHESEYRIPKLYHPHAKTMTIGKRKLTVIFHIEEEYVIVDKILPSCMITY